MQVIQMVVGQWEVCSYIISCEKTGEAVVIDPGGDEDRILAKARAGKLSIKYIVNTHCHPDHTCGNGPIKEATGAQILMHEEDIAYMADPNVSRYFAVLGLPASPRVDRPLRHGELIRFGEEELTVLHTPGHSPGGICLYSRAGAGDCFTGDTLFVDGMGRTDFPECSYETLLHSLRTRLFVLPPETVVWPGHGYGGLRSTIGKEEEGMRPNCICAV